VKGGVVCFTPHNVHIRTSPGSEMSAPLWALLLPRAVTPPLVRDLKNQLRDRPRAGGLCRGYDLRAAPGRCPECGRAAAT
jgi:hypothetical protein